MPTYEYVCPSCGTRGELFRTVSKRDDPAECAACGDFAKRVVSVPLPAHFGPPGQGNGIKYEDGSGMSTNTKLGKRRAIPA